MTIKNRNSSKFPVAVKAQRVTPPHAGLISNNGFTNRVEIINYTDRNVYILNQGNAPFVVTPCKSNKHLAGCASSNVEIRVTSAVSNARDFDATYDFLRKIEEGGVSMSLEAKNLKEKMTNQCSPSLGAMRVKRSEVATTHTFFVPEYEIAEAGFAYVKEANLLISYADAICMEAHPYSNEAWTSPDVRSMSETRHSSGSFVSVVDNDHLCPMYYYYSAKHLVEVVPVTDSGKDSGVYFSQLRFEDGASRVVQTYYNFEEAAEKLGLYSTREEALTAGDPERIMNGEELRLKAENDRIRREIEALRVRAEQQRLSHEAELSRIKFEAQVHKEKVEMRNAEVKEKIEEKATKRKDRFEKKSTRRKDKFDKRSTKRKDRHEESSVVLKAAETALKYAPLLVTGVVALAGGMMLGRGRDKQGNGAGVGYSGFSGSTAMSGQGSVHGAVMEALTMDTPAFDEFKMLEKSLGIKISEIRKDENGKIKMIRQVVDCR